MAYADLGEDKAREAALQRANQHLDRLQASPETQPLAALLGRELGLHLARQAMPGVADEHARAARARLRHHPLVDAAGAAFKAAKFLITGK